MTDFSHEHTFTEAEAVSRLDGVPRREDDASSLSRRELLSFRAIAQVLGKKCREGAELAEEYVRAKVAQETNSARRTAEEAAELVSKQELNEAEADVKRQEAANGFIKNIELVENLSPRGQVLALAKLIESNPELGDQIEKIESLIDSLNVIHGAQVGLLAGPQQSLPDDTD